MHRFLCFFLLNFCFLQSDPTWTTDAMMGVRQIFDIQISPDHESVLFVVPEAVKEEKTGCYFLKIYRSNVQGTSSLFSAPDVSSSHPRWSPDGKWVAFLSKRGHGNQIYLIRSSGGEAVPLTSEERGIQGFSWSPDGKKIAFVMEDETEAEKKREKSSLAYVYDDARSIYRLWVIEPFSETPSPQALTTDDYCVMGSGDFGMVYSEFDWSPDSHKILFSYSPKKTQDSFYLDSSLAEVDLSTGKITPWEKLARYESTPRYSPDGEHAAYLNSDSCECYAINRRVAIRDKNGQGMRLLSKTSNEGPFLVGPNLLGWSKDGRSILFFEPKETEFHLVMLPINGGSEKELKLHHLLMTSPALSRDRSTIAFIGQSPTTPPEVYIARLDDGDVQQVSNMNQSFLQYPQAKTEVVQWKSKDGKRIEGLLTYPIGYVKGKKYPLVLISHGGPMSFFHQTFLGNPYPYPLAVFAQEGFMILRPNPRGSCGYGKEFRCANYRDWGGMDYVDIMTGVDALIAKGLVDPDRMGAMGWSYGGYMTGWIVTQTPRFQAVSIGAGVFNLVSMGGTMDLERFISDYFGNLSKNKRLYEERSPISYVADVQTPCLIQHGTADTRVPVSQSFELYRALKQEGKEAELVLYPGMSHHLTDPNMLQDSMERNLSWFKKHL